MLATASFLHYGITNVSPLFFWAWALLTQQPDLFFGDLRQPGSESCPWIPISLCHLSCFEGSFGRCILWTIFGRSPLCDKPSTWAKKFMTTFGQSLLCDKVLRRGTNFYGPHLVDIHCVIYSFATFGFVCCGTCFSTTFGHHVILSTIYTHA